MFDKQKEKNIERQIGVTLRIGVVISVSIMLVGFVYYLLSNAQTGLSGNHWPQQFNTLIVATMQLKPGAIMMFGLLLLILTPILRVLASIYAFYTIKDWQYVAITTIVLFILMLAMFIGQN